MESPCRVPLFNSIYFVLIPPLMIPGYLIEFFTHYINVLLNPYFFKAKVNNLWLTYLKSFWMSTVTNKPFNFSTSLIYKTSKIKRPPSLMNLPST